jgi:hypothetical protein
VGRPWWTDLLRRQGMPTEEIRAILAAEDPEIVRRYLELHRERLEEQLTEHRRTLARLEDILAREPQGRSLNHVLKEESASAWERSGPTTSSACNISLFIHVSAIVIGVEEPVANRHLECAIGTSRPIARARGFQSIASIPRLG